MTPRCFPQSLEDSGCFRHAVVQGLRSNNVAVDANAQDVHGTPIPTLGDRNYKASKSM